MRTVIQRLCYMIILWCASYRGSAQEMSLSKFQVQVETTIVKTRGASVLITDYDPITKLAYGGRFSGVVVDRDGVILTVAHATMPNQTYQVTFTDGKKYTARGLGRVSSIGLAMLKINEKGDWPIAEMGWSAALKANEPCISIAYPASFDNMMPVVRFGYVAEVSSAAQTNRIRTTCLMEPGDSGGPVFDLSGQVIGMNNNVDVALEANYEVPIDLYRRYWNALLQPEDYKDSPIGESLSPDTIRKVAPIFSDITLYGNSLTELEKKLGSSVIKIRSTVDDKKTQVLGTVLNVNGKIFVVSKSSLVGNKNTFVLSNGKAIASKILYRDEKKDLVLLNAGRIDRIGISSSAVVSDNSIALQRGKFLCSPLPDEAASWSIIGSAKLDLEAKFRAGYSGAGTVMRNGKLILEVVQPGSGASEAKLKAGDEVLVVGDTPVKDPDSYLSEIRKRSPGDLIPFTIQRAGRKDTVLVKLEKYPVITANHPASFFAGGRSVVRDGFGDVYIHDARLTPAECGGPIFDLEGRFIGINIARYSRTSNILLSAAEIESFIKTALIQNIMSF